MLLNEPFNKWGLHWESGSTYPGFSPLCSKISWPGTLVRIEHTVTLKSRLLKRIFTLCKLKLQLVCIPKSNATEPTKMRRKKKTSAMSWGIKREIFFYRWFKPIHVDPVSWKESLLFRQGDTADLKTLSRSSKDAITQESWANLTSCCHPKRQLCFSPLVTVSRLTKSHRCPKALQVTAWLREDRKRHCPFWLW